MSGILKFLTENSIEWLFGDYLPVIIATIAFMVFFGFTCKILHDAAMSQEEWNKKHGNDPKEKKPTAGNVFWCIFLTVAVGAAVCYEMNKINHALPANVHANFFHKSYAANLETNKAGHLLLGGHWKCDNGFDLIITTEKIQEIDSNYNTVNEYLYNVNSINESSGSVFVETELIQGGTSFKLDFAFQDINNMNLYNNETKEYIHYRAEREPYPRHLDDNLQYVLLYGHMGYGFYMDLSTLQVVDEHNWNVKVISVNMDKNGQLVDTFLEKFFIKYEPFTLNNDGEWVPVDVDNTTGSNMITRNAFLTSYYYAFGKNYGSRF